MPVKNEKTLVSTQRLLDGVSLIGSNCGAFDFATDLTQMMESMSKSNFTDDGLAIVVFRSTELTQAIDAHRLGEFRRAVMDFSGL